METAGHAPSPAESPGLPLARGRWATAARVIWHDHFAMVAAGVFIAIVLLSFCAPLYARYIAHTNPFVSNLTGTTIVHGHRVAVLQPSSGLGLGETPIGPTWDIHHFFLGADDQGRDVAARVLYGGRTSLSIGLGAAAGCCAIATILALISGFLGGIVDTVISRLMDILWAFPVFLLAILISTIALTQGLRFGPISISTTSVGLPIFIIGLLFIPYVFRPLRGQVLALRERDFVKAATVAGASNRWLLLSEILPNVLTSVVVFFPLMTALSILVETGLAFLGIGVQPPSASWGTVASDGQALLYSRPWVAIAPGLMITATIVVLNIVGDSLRAALEPRARLRAPGSA